uniref:Uncharacterized protein n=1 Tax=Arundo donax TaxID=35708 RepID=A0A0A8ZBK8_ARUDO
MPGNTRHQMLSQLCSSSPGCASCVLLVSAPPWHIKHHTLPSNQLIASSSNSSAVFKLQPFSVLQLRHLPNQKICNVAASHISVDMIIDRNSF